MGAGVLTSLLTGPFSVLKMTGLSLVGERSDLGPHWFGQLLRPEDRHPQWGGAFLVWFFLFCFVLSIESSSSKSKSETI